MCDYSRDEDFARAWEFYYLGSVYAAAVRAYERAAWSGVEEAYAVLAAELAQRGVEPDPDAVYAGAVLISRGQRPAICRPGGGRRRRRLGNQV